MLSNARTKTACYLTTMWIVCPLLMTAIPLAGGCRSWLIDGTDRNVQRLIADRQQAALGVTSDTAIGPETGEVGGSDRMYSLNPRPVDPAVPEGFRKPRDGVESSTEEKDDTVLADVPSRAEADLSPSIFREDQLDEVVVLGLSDAVAYAMRHARALQDAKEDLYLAALDLTLERHLWTPQFVASAAATFDDYLEESQFDRAMKTVSDVAVSQRLPSGGEVSANIIHTLTRRVSDLVERGETGHLILAAEIPILRGAGKVAYESRYAAERELIYAIRRYERFRRSFLVDVASEYFSLQQAKAAIDNTYVSYLNRKLDWEKAEFIHRKGRSRTIFEAPRAKANFRNAEAALVSVKERYESALDRFKIRVGMPVDSLLDVVDQDQDNESRMLDTLLPDVDEAVAVPVALRYRLDLLNNADRVDDARRGVAVAKNRILPDLKLSGSATLDSDPDHARAFNFREERMSWQGFVNLRIDDRKAERDAYRAALISLRRNERDHDRFVDEVRADVRRALRRIAEKDNVRTIRRFSVEEAQHWVEAARAQYDLGRSTNQAVVDAEDDLLRARNEYAAAVAAYRLAILEFRRDTGTLRVSDDGRLSGSATP